MRAQTADRLVYGAGAASAMAGVGYAIADRPHSVEASQAAFEYRTGLEEACNTYPSVLDATTDAIVNDATRRVERRADGLDGVLSPEEACDVLGDGRSSVVADAALDALVQADPGWAEQLGGVADKAFTTTPYFWHALGLIAGGVVIVAGRRLLKH